MTKQNNEKSLFKEETQKERVERLFNWFEPKVKSKKGPKARCPRCRLLVKSKERYVIIKLVGFDPEAVHYTCLDREDQHLWDKLYKIKKGK